MSNRSLVILGALAAGMVVWAILQTYFAGRVSTVAEMTYLLQGLDPGKINSITLGAGEKTISLKRQDEGFVVASKDGYPAVVGEINKLINACLDVRVQECVTSTPDSHDKLGVTEEKAEAIVKFLDAGGNPITGIIVGKALPAGGGSYVRALGSDDVYVCKDLPYFRDRAIDYMDDKLLQVAQGEAESITMAGPKGPFLLKFQAEPPNVVLDKAPAGKKLKQAEAEYIASRLESLRFNDVMKRSGAKASKLKFDRKVICRLKDGMLYTLELAKEGEDYYLACTAATGDKKASSTQQAADSAAAVEKRAKAFAKRHAGWVYRIDDYVAEDLVKDLSDLLEDEKPATMPASEQPAAKPAE